MNVYDFVSFGGFLLIISFLLALDLGVFHKDDHVVSFKESMTWTCVWVAVAMLFGGAAFIIMGIIGLCTSKGNKRQAVLSGVLLGSLLPGVVSFGLAIGSHF